MNDVWVCREATDDYVKACDRLRIATRELPNGYRDRIDIATVRRLVDDARQALQIILSSADFLAGEEEEEHHGD